jgi:HlyD family secretion protein
MKYNIFDWDELTDSKELYNAQPKPITIIFIYIILLLIISIIIWSYFGEKEVVIKANGVIRSSENTVNITNQVSGEIEEILFQTERPVTKGDLLLKINSDPISSEKEQLNIQLDELKEELELITSLEKSITKDKDFLTTPDDYGYYEQFKAYQSQVDLLDQDIKVSTEQKRNELNGNNQEIKEIEGSIESMKSKSKRIEEFQRVINEGNELPDNNDRYDIRFQQYQMQRNTITEQIREHQENLKQYENKLQEEEEEINEDNEGSEINEEPIKEQIELDKQQIKNFENEKDQLKVDLLLALTTEREELNQAVEELQKNKRLLENRVDNLEGSMNTGETSIEQLQNETLLTINQQKREVDHKVVQTKRELEALKSDLKKYEIRSPIDGYINVIEDVSVGEYIQPHTNFISIVPGTSDFHNDGYVVNIFVDSNQISGVKVGNDITCRFGNLPNNSRGELRATISHISPDVTLIEGQSYYIVEANIENKPLYSYNDEDYYLQNGMSTEVSIITDSKRLIYYALEKLNFLE